MFQFEQLSPRSRKYKPRTIVASCCSEGHNNSLGPRGSHPRQPPTTNRERKAAGQVLVYQKPEPFIMPGTKTRNEGVELWVLYGWSLGSGSNSKRSRRLQRGGSRKTTNAKAKAGTLQQDLNQ